MKFLLVIILVLSFASSETNSGDTVVSKEDKPQRWAALPIIIRTEATGFAIGAAGMYFLPHQDTTSHKSHLRSIGIVSTRKQWVISAAPDIWLQTNKYHITGELSYLYWPSDYHGIGNYTSEKYESILGTTVKTILGLERGWLEKYYLGCDYTLFFDDISSPDTGILSTSKPLGYKGGRVSGTAIRITYDNRNHVQFPTSGQYAKYRLGFKNEFLGSDFDYVLQELELSLYLPAGIKSTLALKVYGGSMYGDTPFFKLLSPNGETVLRGIKFGRYRDKHMAAAMSEYRFPIYKIINGGLFAEMAQVAPEISKFDADGFKYGIGAGIHLAVVPKEMVNLRFDFSYVDEEIGFIIAIMEAF